VEEDMETNCQCCSAFGCCHAGCTPRALPPRDRNFGLWGINLLLLMQMNLMACF